MKIEVWIKGHEDDRKTIELKGTESLTPMSIKDHLCYSGVFSWGDYQKIRYRRLK